MTVPLSHGELCLATLPGGADDARAALRKLGRAVTRLRRSGHTVWLGVGAGALNRAGLSAACPAGLRPMPQFTGDVLDPRRTNPDLLVQAEAANTDGARWLVDQALAGAGVAVAWRTGAYRDSLPVEAGRPLVRNPFGFVEGQSNPAHADSGTVTMLTDPSAPPWAVGGSFLALRVIRIARALWDADPVERQEDIVGRRRDGRWLDGSDPQAAPPFTDDPDGLVTPLESHVRRANPSTPEEPRITLLRRSFAYGPAPGASTSGASTGPEEGLLFSAFTAELDGFETVQRRVATDAMSRYILTVGGGYFLVPRDDATWLSDLIT